MPLVNFQTKADFDAAYSLRGESRPGPGRKRVMLNYHRAAMWPFCEKRAAALVNTFGWPTDTNILIVGAGFGWTAEAMETNHGYTNIVSIDSSNWIQSAQDTSEESEIDAAITAVGLEPTSGEGLAIKGQLYSPGNRRRASRAVENEDLSNNGSRNRVRNILGDISVGISEDVLPALSDSEILDIADRIDRINAGIARIHLVTPLLPGQNQDPAYNWHTLAEYKSLLPSDTFMATGTWEVL